MFEIHFENIFNFEGITCTKFKHADIKPRNVKQIKVEHNMWTILATLTEQNSGKDTFAQQRVEPIA